MSSTPPPVDPTESDGARPGSADGVPAGMPSGGPSGPAVGGPAGGPAPGPIGRLGYGGPSPTAYWRGWPEIRADLRASAGLVLVLAVAGLAAGLIWWWLAPRADFRITDTGPVVIGNPSEELFAADDAVFALVLAVFGLVAGVAAWFRRRRRGVATLLALGIGGSAMAVVAWQLGELLGAAPTEAELSDVGAVVTTALHLASLPALAVAPFTALLAYVAAVVYVGSEDVGRTGDPVGFPPSAAAPEQGNEERPLVVGPPPG